MAVPPPPFRPNREKAPRLRRAGLYRLAAVAATLLVATGCGGATAPSAQPLAAAQTSTTTPVATPTTTAPPTSTTAATVAPAPVARQQVSVPQPQSPPQPRPLVQAPPQPKPEPKPKPKPEPKPEPKPVAKPEPSGGDCSPNYSGCVPIASDVDCAGGSGNGPAYADGPVRVIGSDVYDLDNDNDGTACE